MLRKIFIGGAAAFTMIGMLAVLETMVPVAQAAGGSIKTTTGTCGNPVNKNQYAVGDVMYITGTGFAHNATLPWTVTGLPASNDPNIVVASGTITTDGQGKFCFPAYTILAGDGGEYKADVNGKTDNFQVAVPGATPTPTPSITPTPSVTPTPSPTPVPNATLHVIKVVTNDNGGAAVPGDFTLHVAGNTFAGESAPGTMFALANGTYTVSEDPNPDYMPAITGDCAADGTITLAPGDDKTCTVTNDDIPAQIHGMKFEDLNGDGDKDAGEPGLANWTINLYDGAMVFMASTSTDASGSYEFDNLNVGTYNVRETQKPGWTQTTTNPAPIAAGLGDVIMNVNFGNFKNVNISGFKWNDKNGDGIWDIGEPALAGWTIFIDENANMMLDAGEDSMVTTSSLGYTFSNRGPGTYSVCEVPQAGWMNTFPLGTLCQNVVVDVSGQDVTGVNFGNHQDREGTQGLWRNWNKSKQYSAVQINGWLVTIDGASHWLMNGYSDTTTGLVNLINDATKNCSKFTPLKCAELKFDAQYVTARLDILSGRKNGMTWYAVSADAAALLGITPGLHTLNDVMAATEALSGPLTRDQYLLLAGMYDGINNAGY